MRWGYLKKKPSGTLLHMLPVNLNNFLPVEGSPLRLSPESLPLQKIVELHSSDPEYNYTSAYFMTGRSSKTCIIRIICIYNRFLHVCLLAYLTTREPLSKDRACPTQLDKDLSQSYFPLKLQVKQNPTQLFPVWHGTSLQEPQLMDEWSEMIIFEKIEPLPSLIFEIGEDLLQLPQTEQQFKDVEGFYCRQLLQAKKNKFHQEQIFYLEKISDLYIQKHNWVRAAQLLNGALAILQKNSDNLQLHKYFVSKLEHLEALFLKNNGYQVPPCASILLSYRESLKNIRTLCLEKYTSGAPIGIVTRFLTSYYRKLLGTLIFDSQKLLGPPPVDWVCIGMGSMAREEMCPYSDIEFAFLIAQKTDRNLDYFRALSRLLELKIINLGETTLPLFGQIFGEKSTEASPTPNGFSMDSGGNTPLGKPGFYELIDTPEGLCQFQSKKWMEGDIIITNALSSVCYVAGDKRLLINYNTTKKEKQATTDGLFSFTGTSFGKKLALKLLEAHVQDFKPHLSKEKQELAAFGIKQELYRPFQSFLGGLSLYRGIVGPSSFKIIEQLLDNRLLTVAGAKNLKQALEKVLRLRFEAHTFYQNEGEFLLHIEAGKPQDPQFLYLDKEKQESLQEIYRVLIPFHACVLEFLRTKDLKVFARSSFYSESPTVQGAAFEKELKYFNAQEMRQQAVSLAPNDVHALTALGHIEMELVNYQAAIEQNLNALKVLIEEDGKNSAAVATVYSNIGQGYSELGNFDKALEYHERASKIWRKVLKEDHPNSGLYYNNKKLLKTKNSSDLDSPISKGSSDSEEEDYKIIFYSNREDFEQSLDLQHQVLKEKHLRLATSYNNKAITYSGMGKQQLALEYYQMALKIQTDILGDQNLEVATTYNNLGVFFFREDQLNDSLSFYNKSLKISCSILGANHPSVALLYNNIGCVLHQQQNFEEAFKYHQKARTVFEKVYGKNHIDTAITYIHIADCYNGKEIYNKAQEYYQWGLKILTELLGRKHPSVAIAHHRLGFFYGSICKYDLSVKHLEACFILRLQNNNSTLLSLALNCYEIGDCYLLLKNNEKALEYCENGMNMRIKVLGKKHSLVIQSYKTVGMLYSFLGNDVKMQEYFDLVIKYEDP